MADWAGEEEWPWSSGAQVTDAVNTDPKVLPTKDSNADFETTSHFRDTDGHPPPGTAPHSDSDSDPLFPSSPVLLGNIFSLLHKGYCGTPLPAFIVSFSKPPTSCASVPDGKLQWYGSWRGGWDPRWGTTRPQLQQIKRVVLQFSHFCGMDPENISIEPFNGGMWNKVYLITGKDREGADINRIFRIPLPVNPWYKMQSEVATMEYAREHTSIPIPQVYVFDSSMNNPVGFEWMIMEMMDGERFRDAQHSMSQTALERFYATIAGRVDELSKLKFSHIGSLYRDWDPESKQYLQFKLGPAVADSFLGPRRLERNIFRGPFRNEAAFLSAFTELNLADVLDPDNKNLAEQAWAQAADSELVFDDSSEDEQEEQDATESSKAKPKTKRLTTVYTGTDDFQPDGIQKACFSVLSVLPIVDEKLSKSQPPREYILHHFDISKNNVLVNRDGKAVALLDWENIVTQSLSQVDPWPSLIDPTKYDPLEPCSEEEQKRRWYLEWVKKYNNSLAVSAFPRRLRELGSSWPKPEQHEQHEQPEQKPEDDFESDLVELGGLAQRIYSRWDEVAVCQRIREKCSEMFRPID